MSFPLVSVQRVKQACDSSEKQPVCCPDVTRLCAPKQEVLKQLQGTIEEESGEASGSQLELIERLKGEDARSETGTGNESLRTL